MNRSRPLNYFQYWWSRRCGGRSVLRLALPLIISTASWTVMHFVDRMFLLWESTQAMAAAMPAGLLYFTFLCLPLGVASYANTFVAQYQGAGRPERIGLAVWQAARVGLFGIPVYLASIPLAPAIFRLAGHDPGLLQLEVVFYQVNCFGAGGMLMAAALSSFFTGRGETKMVMYVDMTAALMNVVLDYLWIFGHLGFPAGGIEGAAWATVVSQWFRVLAYWRLMSRPVYRHKYGIVAGRRLDLALLLRLFRYGGPNGLQMLLEVSAFSIFMLLVGRLGELSMAATSLAFNVNMLAFMPMIGLGIAATTMVGQQLGSDRPALAARATWTAFWIAEAYMGTLAALYVIWPDLFLLGHAMGTAPERFGQLRDTTVVLLRFVAAYSLLDAMNVVFVGAIRGAGDTRFILWVNAVTAPMPVIAAWWGITHWNFGLVWCWLVLTVWVCLLALAYFGRFLQGRWKTMRVIEPELPTDDEPPAVEPAVACAG